MADKAETVKDRGSYIVVPATTRKWLRFEVSGVSTDDTITLGDLTTITHAILARKSDGSGVEFAKSGNVLTVTEEGLSNADLVGYAEGT